MNDLEEKDRGEREHDLELAVEAKVQLEEWYAKYNEKIEATKAENRIRQEELLKEDLGGENPSWEKVVNLCSFKSSGGNIRGDTNRMRSIILKMKETSSKNLTKPQSTNPEGELIIS